MRWGHIDPSVAAIELLNDADIRELRLVKGDLLVCEGGEIGRSSVWRDEVPEAYYLNTLHRLRPKQGYEPELAAAYLEYFVATGALQAIVGKSSLAHLTKENLLRLPLPVPPLDEQAAIAATLRSADDLTVSLERLIAKKRDVKQGMMQELLTGRTRLPGFMGDWCEVELGVLGVFLKGRGINRDQVRSSGVPCIRYGEIYTAYRNYARETVSFVDPDVAMSALPIRSGDLLFAGSGETKAEIGMTVAYVGDAAAVAGGDIIVLRGTGFDPVFVGSLLNTPQLAAQKASRGQGDAVVHIGASALSALRFRLPDIDEQREIANILQYADAEIEALRRRLESARAVKVGMMQELLTGRTRLRVTEEA
ncbi:restriction endonuclease subunit S [Arthrobacter sp. RAF14]|uniref:restriction endonuclease subunit S n=1 Tax=Arthrobacter sp. RAF14 TaxID=3233051 RepID=UPI003F919B2A